MQSIPYSLYYFQLLYVSSLFGTLIFAAFAATKQFDDGLIKLSIFYVQYIYIYIFLFLWVFIARQGDLWAPHGEGTTDNVQHETYNMQHKESQFNMNILISCLKCANKLHIAHFASPMA